ncbi:hypothetical protein RND81_08G161000 [Saponaria officinalis]|uniref:Homeobox domain-containing protein n=1 Tax=Saponaria officinalis TaxID=3572 RepID=A0AAW1J8C7_SAPOF
MSQQYYVTHQNTTTQSHLADSDHHNNNNNLHTLLLMNNPNLVPHFDHHHQQSSNNNNIIFVNSSTAAAYAQPPPPPYPHHNVTLYGYPQEEARDSSRARQGLSLSLSSQNPGGGGGGGGGAVVSVFGSKYLRVAQELLEEVVNVGDTLTGGSNHDHSPKKGKGVFDTPSGGGDSGGGGGGDGGGGGGGGLLCTSERHEIQMKKAKLVTMLDEAEQRYKQYNHQMQIVIESFERAAGIGSAKTYTALALKTISKQFRCLKDAIQGQIRAANKSLGEDEGGSGSSAGKIQGSRLKFIDHQIRQQRALQQLGMIQNHNAWRPQRGLPERSVSVLRAWLFEHFLHPYPKDSDKILLAKQTGLTRSQVSNWFINARVRLWKPMIEEMYNEELKEHEQINSEDKENSNEDDIDRVSNPILEHEKINNSEIQIKSVKLDQHNNVNNSSSFVSIQTRPDPNYQPGFTLTGSLEMGAVSQGSPKRQRGNQLVSNNGGEILIKFGDEKQEMRDNNNNNNNNGFHSSINSEGMNFIGGELGSYPNMGDLGRFETEDFSTRFLQGNNNNNNNGGISLSLGLPPSCDNHHQQHFNDLSSTTHHHHHPFMSSPTQNIQFRRGNDFAAQLLPDFVALR